MDKDAADTRRSDKDMEPTTTLCEKYWLYLLIHSHTNFFLELFKNALMLKPLSFLDNE